MSTWALVPIKPRALCKTRLASVLSPARRIALVRTLLDHVLATLRATAAIDHIALVSAERDCVADDVRLLLDHGNDLNSSLESGVARAIAAGATTVLILPADLPLLTVGDVEQLLGGARRAGIALAPDRHERGTNAVCMTLPARLELEFGEDSFRRHRRQAAGRGTEAACVRSESLGFDVDTVADWQCFAQRTRDPASNPSGRISLRTMSCCACRSRR